MVRGFERTAAAIAGAASEACFNSRMQTNASHTQGRALTTAAFATLLLIAAMMGANHVAARLAFDHGVDVVTAVVVRSTVTALVVGTLLLMSPIAVRLQRRQRLGLVAIGSLIAVQSVCLYSAVARLPVALALLAFNTYPLWTALWARLAYGHRPERRTVMAMPVILVGLALVLTQHEAGDLDGRLRTAATMSIVALLAVIVATARGGLHLPNAPVGWFGLAALTFLYGTAITILFTVLPRLGVVGNSAIMNVEPIFALVLAWAILGQTVAAVQVVGGLIVVAMVVWLGLRR